MNIFFICAIFFIYYWCIEFWSQVRNVGCEVEGLCFVHTSIKKFPWVTLQGSRIVLVISYPATLKRDMIATATYGDRHHQIDHPRRRHLLILKVRQKHVICQCRQINSLVNLKFFTRVLRLGTCFLITIIFDLYCHFFKVRISQTICLIFTTSATSTFRAFWLAPVTGNILGYWVCDRSQDGVSLRGIFRRRNLSDKWSSRTNKYQESDLRRKKIIFMLNLQQNRKNALDKIPGMFVNCK